MRPAPDDGGMSRAAPWRMKLTTMTAAALLLAWPEAANANTRIDGECRPAQVAPSDAFNAAPVSLPGNFPGFESSSAAIRIEDDHGATFALTEDRAPHPFPAYRLKEVLPPGSYTAIVDDECSDALKLVPTVRRFPFTVVASSPLPRSTGTITRIEVLGQGFQDSIRYRVHLRPSPELRPFLSATRFDLDVTTADERRRDDTGTFTRGLGQNGADADELTFDATARCDQPQRNTVRIASSLRAGATQDEASATLDLAPCASLPPASGAPSGADSGGCAMASHGTSSTLPVLALVVGLVIPLVLRRRNER